MEHQRTTYTHQSKYIKAQITCGHCLKNQKGQILSSTVQVSNPCPLEMSSQLQCNQSIKLTQPNSPARHMTPCTLTSLTAPGTCIPVSTGIMPDSENLLRKGSAPDDDCNRGECNEVGEAIMGPSTMDMNPYPSRHIPTTGVTATMIQ